MLTVIMLGAALVLGLAGLVFTRSAQRQSGKNLDFLQRSSGARAEVVDVREKYRPRAQSDDMPTYFPVVMFDLPDGRRVEAEVMIGARPSPAKVGTSVDVRYDPAKPQRVVLASGLASAGSAGCFATGLGVVFLVFAGLVVLLWALLVLVLKVPA